jgi:hypothetical protein
LDGLGGLSAAFKPSNHQTPFKPSSNFAGKFALFLKTNSFWAQIKKARDFSRAPNFFNSFTILTHDFFIFENRARNVFFF